MEPSPPLPRPLRAAFRDAFRGFAALARTQRNARLHCAATFMAVLFGAVLHIEPFEWIAVALSIGLVLVAEALNTSIELLADAVHPGQHPPVGRAKDVAAAGVLLAALTAVSVAAIVVVPRIPTHL